MNESKRVKIYILPILFIGLLTGIDQLTKFMIVSKYELFESTDLIKGVFSITYIRNSGVAWGMLQGRRVAFLIITFIALMFAFKVYYNVSNEKKYIYIRICLVLLVSGAIGNMIDRVRLGYVVDFLDFNLINFPVFNVADMFVVVGIILLFLLIVFKYSNEEFDEILRIRNKVSDNDESDEDE